nr:MAG TPA: TFIIB zinc-binding [Caudoviricetes sp.]
MRSCIERAFQRLRGYCAKKTNCDNCHFVTSNGDCALNITEALLKAISKVGGSPLSEWDTVGVVSLVANQPAADVAPVRRGHWVMVGNGTTCSECMQGLLRINGKQSEWVDLSGMPYCPNCGAKMEALDDD